MHLGRLLLVFALTMGGFSQLASGQDSLSTLERIAVQDKGRKKPLLSFSEESLRSIHGKISFRDSSGTSHSATEVIFSLWLGKNWDEERLFLVGQHPLRGKLGLDDARKYYSYTELAGSPLLSGMVKEARLFKGRNPQASLPAELHAAVDLDNALDLYSRIRSGEGVRVVPVPEAKAEWQNAHNATNPEIHRSFVALTQKIKAGETEELGSAVQQFAEQVRTEGESFYPTAFDLGLEAAYFKVHPFRYAWILYSLGFVVLLATMHRWVSSGYRLGWSLVGLGFLAQTAGFACRVYIAGRPPVTNMYETVIWMSFGAVAFALSFEAIHRNRYFLLAASPIAVLSLVLADTQPVILDPAINPIMPVLRNNFWLTVHVLTIVLSYAAFFLALGLGNIVLFQAFRGKGKSLPAALYSCLYSALKIGVLLLATGTMLGAVWANYSWGRFWDWDPKETWALIALLVYLAVLHGRLAGWWGGFGLAIGSVLGCVPILMAWYGVNFLLGVGLHSYGFGTGGKPLMFSLLALQLLFAAVASWRYRASKKQSPPVTETESVIG